MRCLLDSDRQVVLEMLVCRTQSLPGEIAEIGVFQGGSARVILDSSKEKRLHLFDTFKGIPDKDKADGGSHVPGDFACSASQVRSNLGNDPRLSFHEGRVPQSLRGFKEHLSFVHVDTDTYQSIVDCIDAFFPLLVPGGIMLFDDYKWIGTPGVDIAVKKKFPPNTKIYSVQFESSYVQFENSPVYSNTLVTNCWVVKQGFHGQDK